MTGPGAAAPAGFTPFAIPWDAPQMDPAALASLASAFEWWYFDLATADGVELVAILSRQNPVFARHRCSLYLEYHDASRSVKYLRDHPPSAFRWRDGAEDRELRVADSAVRIVGADPRAMRYEVSITAPRLTATLTMVPEHRGFLPTPDGRYFVDEADPGRYTAVSFSAPLMRTTGTITVDGVAREVSGRGYHDHPWGTVQIFRTHERWNWARAATPSEGVMFATVTPADGFTGALTFCYSAATGQFEPTITASVEVTGTDWRKDSLLGIRYPHALTVVTPTQRYAAAVTGTMLDTPIYDRSAVSWTPAPPAAAGTGWVEYYHLASWARGLAFLGARIQAFFLRPFPWFGR